MSNIHYFQRYTQKENIVTNNTMLLFSRLYHHDIVQFNQFLQLLLPDSIDDLSTAIQFHQQKRTKGSIPDAVIHQPSIKIVIETKLYGQENLDQLKSHCEEFKHEDLQLLLLIDREEISDFYRQDVIRLINEINDTSGKKISFASVTFKDICKSFNEVLTHFDREMQAIIYDYENFCLEANLIDNADTKMRAVSVGDTVEQNLAYDLYDAPTNRGYRNHKYIGLYNEKMIKAVGEIIAIADITYDLKTDLLTVENIVKGEISEQQKSDVKKVIIEAKEKFGYSISTGHRFFFVDRFFETTYHKVSKYGMISIKYFDLLEINGFSKTMGAKEIANFLKDKEWE